MVLVFQGGVFLSSKRRWATSHVHGRNRREERKQFELQAAKVMQSDTKSCTLMWSKSKGSEEATGDTFCCWISVFQSGLFCVTSCVSTLHGFTYACWTSSLSSLCKSASLKTVFIEKRGADWHIHPGLFQLVSLFFIQKHKERCNYSSSTNKN